MNTPPFFPAVYLEYDFWRLKTPKDAHAAALLQQEYLALQELKDVWAKNMPPKQ